MSPPVALPPEKEAQFQARVVSWAKMNGWLVYAPPANAPIKTKSGRVHQQGIAAGWPDLTMVNVPQRRIVFAELKGGRTDRRATVAAVERRPEWLRDPGVTDLQAEWLHALALVAEAIAGPLSRDLATVEHAGDQMPGLEVYVWRPSDWTTIEEVLHRAW